jgi:tripartite-type tricarboxylate transporter receptor subunit TctC
MNSTTLLATIAAFSIAACTHAQDYPVKPIRMIVPYSPGGPVDIVGRLTAQKLTDELKQQVIVDNRAGGGGNIAVETVARSMADGYTLLFGSNGTNAINPGLYKNLAVDPVKDLVAIDMVAASPMILVTHPSLAANSVKEFVALAKSRPGTLNYASAGSGSTSHLAGELFKSMTGINIVHVPYKGAGPGLTDLVGGQVQFMLTAISSTLPHVKSGRLKALAVSSEKRMALLPELPALNEEIPGYEVSTWYGMFAPVQMQKRHVDKLNQALVKIVSTADMRQRLAALGAEPVTLSPEQFALTVRKEIAKWAKVIKDSGARPD